MNIEIDDILSNINSSILSFYEEYQKQISNFSGRKFDWKIIINFKDFLLTKMGAGNQNLNIQICNEIITNINLSNIYNSKGFKELMKSIFSENHLLYNKIDILKTNRYKNLSYLNAWFIKNYFTKFLELINMLLFNDIIQFDEKGF